MDLLGAALTRVVRRRGTGALQTSAALATVLVVTATGGWPFAGGAAVERLAVSSSASAPELPDPLLSPDDRRAPLGLGPAAAGLPVSTTTATALVVVDGPTADPAGTERAFAAYRTAADAVAATQPGCRLSWTLLAGIGLVESGHGTVFGGHLDTEGRATPPILGPRLDGNGFALITDTDRGVFDGDTELDRATGPMQFIPGTWARWGSDGDGDGVADPQDVDDAALAAGRYLCASGGRLDTPAGLVRAVFSYNHSYDYVRLVLTVTARYLGVEPSALGVDRLPAPAPAATTPEPAPTGPAPGQQPPPGEPAPAEPAPGQPAPGQPAPGQPAPPQPEPAPPAPGEPAPDPGGTPPGEPTPSPEPSPTPETCPTLPGGAPRDPACPPLTGTPAAA